MILFLCKVLYSLLYRGPQVFDGVCSDGEFLRVLIAYVFSDYLGTVKCKISVYVYSYINLYY